MKRAEVGRELVAERQRVGGAWCWFPWVVVGAVASRPGRTMSATLTRPSGWMANLWKPCLSLGEDVHGLVLEVDDGPLPKRLRLEVAANPTMGVPLRH